MAFFCSCGEQGLHFAVVFEDLIAVASLQQLQHVGLELWRTGLAARWHVESYWTRDLTGVPCIGRQILTHCTTEEV